MEGKTGDPQTIICEVTNINSKCEKITPSKSSEHWVAVDKNT